MLLPDFLVSHWRVGCHLGAGTEEENATHRMHTCARARTHTRNMHSEGEKVRERLERAKEEETEGEWRKSRSPVMRFKPRRLQIGARHVGDARALFHTARGHSSGRT